MAKRQVSTELKTQKKTQAAPALAMNLPPERIEFLMQSSQQLWRETSFERLLTGFLKLLKQNFSLGDVGFYTLRTENKKLTMTPHSVDLKGFTTLTEDFVNKLSPELLALNLKNQEYRQGLNTYHFAGRDLFFVLMGDPASEWLILLWDGQGDKARQDFMLIDFLVRQLQSGCSWFNRLDKTQALLYRDDLTGLFNSRYLEIALESEIRRAQRFQTGFCLLFIDLDNFKSINDQHGHMAGSNILKQVADVLRDTSREVDSVIRYGGDEFIILLLGATPTTGLLAGERIRRRLSEVKFDVDGVKIPLAVTASIGVASFPDHANDKETLLKLADETMYSGKRLGKNRVMVVGQARSEAEVAIANEALPRRRS